MPYILKRFKNGYKVCKKSDSDICFSKEPLPLETAEKQKTAIQISEAKEDGKDPKGVQTGFFEPGKE